MDVTLYRILDLHARAWPSHQGDRPAQRQAIRRALETLRWTKASAGGHVHIGAFGTSIHYTRAGYGDCTLSGYGLAHCGTALAAMAAGVPWVDTRDVEDVGALIAAPLVALSRPADPEPWGPLSYAPLAAVFARLAAAGARTGNLAGESASPSGRPRRGSSRKDARP